ncbi:MAG: DUF1294 domain-containing protein [Leptolinea sp.]
MNIFLTWYAVSSIVLFLMYGLDKAQAVAGGRRISEKTLHILSLTGGFAGGFLGRFFFRHKTRKPLFLWVLSISAALHCFAWLLWLIK